MAMCEIREEGRELRLLNKGGYRAEAKKRIVEELIAM